jgi:hypothetical protein
MFHLRRNLPSMVFLDKPHCRDHSESDLVAPLFVINRDDAVCLGGLLFNA